MQTSLETTATIGPNRQLLLDEDLPPDVSKKVRVIVLFDEDIDDSKWQAAAKENSAFEFLADDAEDIYTLDDGKPIDHET
ncbi:MAG: hypothetical protein IPM50_09870 [Acidobacteriota bacterium]|nr:MAG: hypothetical protein IPM50_09870 [Acidobacteriota bacterium]